MDWKLESEKASVVSPSSITATVLKEGHWWPGRRTVLDDSLWFLHLSAWNASVGWRTFGGRSSLFKETSEYLLLRERDSSLDGEFSFGGSSFSRETPELLLLEDILIGWSCILVKSLGGNVAAKCFLLFKYILFILNLPNLFDGFLLI